MTLLDLSPRYLRSILSLFDTMAAKVRYPQFKEKRSNDIVLLKMEAYFQNFPCWSGGNQCCWLTSKKVKAISTLRHLRLIGGLDLALTRGLAFLATSGRWEDVCTDTSFCHFCHILRALWTWVLYANVKQIKLIPTGSVCLHFWKNLTYFSLFRTDFIYSSVCLRNVLRDLCVILTSSKPLFLVLSWMRQKYMPWFFNMHSPQYPRQPGFKGNKVYHISYRILKSKPEPLVLLSGRNLMTGVTFALQPLLSHLAACISFSLFLCSFNCGTEAFHSLLQSAPTVH